MALFRRRTRSDARPLCAGTTHASHSDGVGSGFVNDISGQGGDADRQAWTSYTAGCDLNQLEVDDLTRTNAVARRISREPGAVSMGAGFHVRGSVNGSPVNVLVGGPDLQKEETPDPIVTWSNRFGVPALVIEADAQARAHGLSMWVYGVDDGQLSSEPLNFGGIRSLRWVKVVSRRSVTAMAWGTDPGGERFEQPTIYQVTFRRSGITALYHWTRVHAWTGVELSDEQRANSMHNDDGGGSVFDLVWSALKGYGVSHQQALEALSLLSQGVWSNDKLARAIESKGGAQKAHDVYKAAKEGGGLYGDYILSEGESYSIVGRPVQGIGEVLERMRDALVVASDMPEPAILGAAPSESGLTNDTGGLIRAWYSRLAIDQPSRFGRPLLGLYTIASRATNGPTGGIPILELVIGWPLLWTLTPKEAAEVRKLNAESRAIDVGGQPVVSVGEARSDMTVVDEYELAPEGVSEVEGVEAEAPAIEDIEIADADIMPPGERPLTLREARDIIGVRSNAGVRSFIARTNTPLFRPGAGFRVFESHIRAAMRETQVL